MRIQPLTGRTHQIRVHLSEAGHPILGDVLYASRERPLAPLPFAPARHLLHAEELEFVDPGGGEVIHAQAPMPEDMLEAIRALRSHTRGR